MKRDIRIILPDIRSVLNVGGIFRTADATGVQHIYLCGYTPAPLDRFERPRQDFHKSALGAELTVPWSQHPEVLPVIEKLKQDGYQIIAVEQDAKSTPYHQIEYSEKVALVFGNEVDGVSGEVLDAADVIAELPMLGQKESLNVGVTVGVMLYEIFKT